MDMDHATKMLGGAYEFMGVAVRTEERNRRLTEMKKLAEALKKGLADTRTISPDEIIASLPKALLAGGDTDQLKQIIARYRASLYPESVTLDVASAERVLKAQEVANILKPGEVDLSKLLDRAALGG
jgi:NitT/TauT family transport system substrate-binding protein